MFQSATQHSRRHWSDWLRRPKGFKEPTEVLAPYRRLKRSKVKLAFGLVGLMLFCFIYGFFFSVLVPNAFAFLMAPLAVVGLLVIWALPESNWAPTRSLEMLFFAMFIALIVWPNYLAIALPGLPWITLIRLTSFPLVLILLTCISMSADFRGQMRKSLVSLKAVPILLATFVAIQLISIGLSKDIATSIQKFVVAQTTWTASFFAAVYLFRKPGQIKTWSAILWGMAIFVALIGIWEFRIQRLPWLGHIPSFLKIDDEAVGHILAGNRRAGTTLYRSQSTFSTPLGLAEYLALCLPFGLHFLSVRFSPRTRFIAWCSIPIVLYACYLTDAKLGMVGSLVALVAYSFSSALRNWMRNKGSLVAASSLFSFFLAFGVVVAALMFVHRFKILILGDASHDNSTAARIAQYTLGYQKLLAWPFGYGIGMGGATLGFGQDLGSMTIDTYYLSVALEYGVVGFIVYYGMFAIAIYEGFRRYLLAPSKDEDRSFILPISVSLVAFVVIKGVFSQQDNHPVVFMMLGALVALSSPLRRPSPRPAIASAYGTPMPARIDFA
jgi:hypothetical protein